MGNEEKAEASPKLFGTVDTAFDKFSSYLSDRISTFVAFLFLLISLGSFYGYYIVPRFPQFDIYLLLTPVVLALIAYYNRTFATILFVLLFFVVLIL
ncbi:MAG: hypothetical protein CL943_01120 [Candidatus Diapherotrites archaeon]|uniref:Uncharacterized protein n=1 Tax=Candidatus Iainarchaeum sp. TaxID=3101447 RepID=A0A2D6M0E0_9ARCH|nr:hypothetical protein [Candidatus Diapherotrites archaeon]|tara:strand:+ start:696 stop:986 length:291 start_codon:yes stop_codon:yes gene_type:complete